MKVLDPFAGYRLAMGHPIFHFSLFVGSYTANYYTKFTPTEPKESIYTLFTVLRWSHFTLFVLAMQSAFANRDSGLPLEEDSDKKATKEEIQLSKEKTRHRDGMWKIYSRVCDTLSVFFYSAVIFYVQMTVYNVQLKCEGEHGCVLAPPSHAEMVWLYIEVYCFYIYMISGVFFIIFH